MDNNKNVSENINENQTIKQKKLKFKKIPMKTLMMFLGFELLFTVCTAPFILLYGPFQNAKSAYVGAAMSSMTHQYLAKMFLSDEKIAEVLGTSETTTETTNTSQIEIPKVKDETIEYYKIETDKYTGHYLVIKDPTRVKVGYTSKLNVEGETTSQIAKNNDAIAAVNGGAFTDQSSNQKWTGNGGFPSGLIMSGGKIIYNDLGEEKEDDEIGMTKDGVLITGVYSVKKLEELGVQEALNFGPSLVINGKMTPMTGDGGQGVAPRTVIGQRKDGAIILLVIDGRSLSSPGATLKEVQEVMYKLGAINAANLDGGKSTTMYYDGDIINTPSYSMGERSIPTAIIVK